MKRASVAPWLWIVTAVALAGFALRMIRLVDVPPRWDEGWSVAHAALPIDELLVITAADVHPPLYYLLLGAWQNLFGVSLAGARYLSVLMSLPAIPLAWVTGRVLLKSPRAGLFAAALTAWLPLLVYYGAVIRMYALAPSFVLLATWAALRLVAGSRRPVRAQAGRVIAFVVGAAGAMLALYHAAWALAVLGVCATLMALRRRGAETGLRSAWVRVGPLWAAIALSALAFAPWAVYALPQLYARAAAEAGVNTAQSYPISYFIEQAWIGLTLSQQAGWSVTAVIGAVMLAGLAASILKPQSHSQIPTPKSKIQHPLLLPLLTIVFTLAGVAIAARHWTLNARMLVGAAPALALALAWAFEQLARWRWPAAVVAALALGGVYADTSAGLVYEKSLEVFDPYNPHAYHDTLAPQGRPSDVAIFNVLSPAGFYALDRQPSSPAWSYALTWDPVIEPRARWEARIQALAREHPRFWLVLYRGLAGANGDLRGWVDSNYYPALAQWGEEEVFYGLYGVARGELTPGAGAGSRWGDLELRQARLAVAVRPGDVIPVALMWRALAPLPANLKIFVHAVDDNGAVVAQHDAQPLNDLRPMTTLPVGEDVNDRHGLALPVAYTGRLRVLAGIYDPATGQRVLTMDGRDAVTIGEVAVR